MIKLAEFVFKWLLIYQTVYFHQNVLFRYFEFNCYIKEGLLNFWFAYQFIPSFLCLEDVLPLGKENFHTFAGVSIK